MVHNTEQISAAIALDRHNIEFILKELKSYLGGTDADGKVIRNLKFYTDDLVSIAELLKSEADRNEKKFKDADKIKAAYSKWMAEKETIMGLNCKMDDMLIQKNKEIAVLKQRLESVEESYRKYREEIERLEEITAHQRFIAEMKSGKSNAYRHDVQEEEVYRLFKSGAKKEELAERYGVCVRTIERRINKVEKMQKEAEEKAREEMDSILKEIGADSMKCLDNRKAGETYYEMRKRIEAGQTYI